MTARIPLCTFVAAMALTPMSPVCANNLIQNGDFSSGTSGWTVFTAKDTPKGNTEVVEGVFKLTAPVAGTQSHVRQIITPVRIEPGKRYEIAFDARNNSSKASELVLVIGPKATAGAQAEHYGLWRKVPLTAEWASHKFNFKAKDESDPEQALLKVNMGFLEGVTEIRNVRLAPLP